MQRQHGLHRPPNRDPDVAQSLRQHVVLLEIFRLGVRIKAENNADGPNRQHNLAAVKDNRLELILIERDLIDARWSGEPGPWLVAHLPLLILIVASLRRMIAQMSIPVK